jgi:hypothetical protein
MLIGSKLLSPASDGEVHSRASRAKTACPSST